MEQCLTTKGTELIRISVVDSELRLVYDTLVLPSAPVVDYCTRWSGVTQEMLDGVTTQLQDVQRDLLAIISADTILVGHSLENDLKAMKVIKFIHFSFIIFTLLCQFT